MFVHTIYTYAHTNHYNLVEMAIKWHSRGLTATNFNLYIQFSLLFFTYLHFLQHLDIKKHFNSVLEVCSVLLCLI